MSPLAAALAALAAATLAAAPAPVPRPPADPAPATTSPPATAALPDTAPADDAAAHDADRSDGPGSAAAPDASPAPNEAAPGRFAREAIRRVLGGSPGDVAIATGAENPDGAGGADAARADPEEETPRLPVASAAAGQAPVAAPVPAMPGGAADPPTGDAAFEAERAARAAPSADARVTPAATALGAIGLGAATAAPAPRGKRGPRRAAVEASPRLTDAAPAPDPEEGETGTQLARRPPLGGTHGRSPAPVSPGHFACRDPRIAGTPIPTLGGAGTPCGIYAPVRISRIGDVVLGTPATLDCPTARRVAHWLEGVASPLAERHLGSRIIEIDVMGSYACRTRNHTPGGRISEHGRGRALDVGGFRLADGRWVTVEDDWGRGPGGAFLRDLHGASCGLFMTVLGPGSDRHHSDHFHLDTAQRNGQPYCR